MGARNGEIPSSMVGSGEACGRWQTPRCSDAGWGDGELEGGGAVGRPAMAKALRHGGRGSDRTELIRLEVAGCCRGTGRHSRGEQIVYLDFVDFTKASKQANINYGFPRMAHIQNEDFDYLTSVDLYRASKKPFALGFLPLKDICRTPYSARAIILAEEKLSKAPQTFHNQEDQSISQNRQFCIYFNQQYRSNVSELVQTKESKLEEKVNANITPSMQMQKQLDIVQNGKDTDPNQICFPNVNTPTLNLQQNSPFGNSVSVTEQKSPAVSVLDETKSKEMFNCCPSVPFLSQNNVGLDIILYPLDNSSFKHVCTPNDLSSQTVEDLTDGIEFSMEYAENF
ncbi:hypothetical protein ZWY2020_034645 [Hordeum vulgare]|nr:hypothetical protein ZWY2020_034645 [Hordeum vulgare]